MSYSPSHFAVVDLVAHQRQVIDDLVGAHAEFFDHRRIGIQPAAAHGVDQSDACAIRRNAPDIHGVAFGSRHAVSALDDDVPGSERADVAGGFVLLVEGADGATQQDLGLVQVGGGDEGVGKQRLAVEPLGRGFEQTVAA